MSRGWLDALRCTMDHASEFSLAFARASEKLGTSQFSFRAEALMKQLALSQGQTDELRRQIAQGARRRAARDLEIAREWCPSPLEEDVACYQAAVTATPER